MLEASHYKFDGVWKLTRWSRTPHRIIVHNQRTLQDMAEPYFNKEPWCPRDASARLGLHLGVLVCRTASICISMYWVRGYTVPAVPRADHLVSYFNKERRCPVYFNKELWCPGLVSVSLGLHLGVLVW